MPRDGYDTITVPETLLDRLDERRDDTDGRRSYAGVIEDMLDATETSTEAVKPATTADIEALRNDLKADLSREIAEELANHRF